MEGGPSVGGATLIGVSTSREEELDKVRMASDGCRVNRGLSIGSKEGRVGSSSKKALERLELGPNGRVRV